MTPSNLVKSPDVGSVTRLAGDAMRTAEQLVDRIRAMSEVAHVLTPSVAVSSIADHYSVNTAVVVIDTRLPPVEYGSAAGNDVYFQKSIHKSNSRKLGDDSWETTVVEVSLNKTGLLKILNAAGVNITKSANATNNPYPVAHVWPWVVEGSIVDFDGSKRQLMPGNVVIDYSDGSEEIGGWTAAEWKKRVEEADQRRAAAKTDRDKKQIKPEPINGWSEERVRNARRFGSRIAESEAMNRLARNLGVKQKYTIEELQKPFVLFRCSYTPDMSDPRTREIVTAAHMGVSSLLFPPTQVGATFHTEEPGPDVIDVQAETTTQTAEESRERTATKKPPVEAASTQASGTPSGAEDFDDLPEETKAEPVDHLVSAQKLAIKGVDHFFFGSRKGQTFVTTDNGIARALLAAKKSGAGLRITGEGVQIDGKPYCSVVEFTTAGAAASMPDIKRL